jgi:DNA-binding NarL/FixJ family response regulator
MSIRVAVVEDSQDVREGLAWLFRNSDGFDCVGAYDTGEEALQKLPAVKPDVVLMDIGLPGISGIDCIVRLRSLCPAAQVVMLSVFEDEDRIFRSLAAGATGYLLKKTPPTGILEAVKDLHAGGSPMSSQIARKVLRSFRSPGGDQEPAAQQEYKAPETEATEHLCPRERQILELLAKGHRYKEIADELGITIHTVRTFIRRMYEKLQVHSRTEALLKAPAGGGV